MFIEIGFNRNRFIWFHILAGLFLFFASAAFFKSLHLAFILVNIVMLVYEIIQYTGQDFKTMPVRIVRIGNSVHNVRSRSYFLLDSIGDITGPNLAIIFYLLFVNFL